MKIDTTNLIKVLEERKRQLSKWTDKYRAEERIDEIDCIIDTDVPYLVKEESEKPVPSDLEEAAEEYAYNNWEDNDYHTGASEGLPFDAIGHTEKCFIAGAKWQKEQMMKEAVEGTYNNSDWGTPCIDLPAPLNLERFDKVRIIIVKED